jgi:glycosyltransferase involved in cell wall biosynthesis
MLGTAYQTLHSGPAVQQRPPRIALYETEITGHRGPYLAAICGEAVQRGWEVTVVTVSPDRDHPYFSKIRALVGDANLIFTPFWDAFPGKVTPLSLLRYHFRQWGAARRALLSTRRNWDFVYALNIDYMDKAIQLLGAPSRPVPMSGMTMRVRFHLNSLGVATHRAVMSSLASWSFSHLLRTRSLAGVTTADPSLLRYCQHQLASRYRKIFYVPEMGMEPPSVSALEARRDFGFGPHDKVILIFGAIDERKGYEELIEAVPWTGGIDPLRILVIGNASESARRALDGPRYERLRRQGLLVTRLQFADDDLQARAFALADLVWVAYRNHSTMSGVFAQAMSCSVPVIAPDYGLLSWLVSQYEVGIRVNTADPVATGAQIAQLLRDPERLAALRRNAALMSSRHSPRNFGAAVCDAIAAGLARGSAGAQARGAPVAG